MYLDEYDKEILKAFWNDTFLEERKQIDQQIDDYFEKAMQHAKKEVAL